MFLQCWEILQPCRKISHNHSSTSVPHSNTGVCKISRLCEAITLRFYQPAAASCLNASLGIHTRESRERSEPARLRHSRAYSQTRAFSQRLQFYKIQKIQLTNLALLQILRSSSQQYRQFFATRSMSNAEKSIERETNLHVLCSLQKSFVQISRSVVFFQVYLKIYVRFPQNLRKEKKNNVVIITF